MTNRAHHAYHFPVLVERLYRELGVDPELNPDPQPAPIRFRTNAGLEFAPGEVITYRRHPTPGIEVAFLGLQGSQSPLPGYYLDALAWYQRQQQNQLTEFLDLFHQRWLTLLHRIWRKYRYELRARPGGTDCLSRCLLALSGPPPTEYPARAVVERGLKLDRGRTKRRRPVQHHPLLLWLSPRHHSRQATPPGHPEPGTTESLGGEPDDIGRKPDAGSQRRRLRR